MKKYPVLHNLQKNWEAIVHSYNVSLLNVPTDDSPNEKFIHPAEKIYAQQYNSFLRTQQFLHARSLTHEFLKQKGHTISAPLIRVKKKIPFLAKNFRVSFSHNSQFVFVLLSLAKEIQFLGVDIENTARKFSSQIALKILSPLEQQIWSDVMFQPQFILRIFSLKEALYKAFHNSKHLSYFSQVTFYKFKNYQAYFTSPLLEHNLQKKTMLFSYQDENITFSACISKNIHIL